MDILEKKLQEHPELEQFFNEDGEDGFFVKNLENIQGDERDIILISIGYGVDQNNKLSLSFGPLNKEGGECCKIDDYTFCDDDTTDVKEYKHIYSSNGKVT